MTIASPAVTRFGSHLRHNLVAYVALFFALSGTAIAAKPLITGADVQDGSLSGVDVQNDSLAGDDVLESSLGQVPSAQNADHVADADMVDGMDSSRLARFGGIVDGLGVVEVVEGTGGFTVEREGLGFYKISFPSGTFSGCHRPIATVSPTSGGGAPMIASILSPSEVFQGPDCSNDGSASFFVHIQNAITGSTFDTPRFYFTAL